MKWLRVAWGFVKTFWWVILLVLAVVATGVVLILNRRRQHVLADAVSDETPSLVGAAREKVQDAVTDVRIERALIGAKTEVRRAEIEDIRGEPDGVKRRERLADLLRESL